MHSAGHFQAKRPSDALVGVFLTMRQKGFGTHQVIAAHDAKAPSGHEATSSSQRGKPRYTAEQEQDIQNGILFPVWNMSDCPHNATGAASPICVPPHANMSLVAPAVDVGSSGGPPADGAGPHRTGPVSASSGPAQGGVATMSVAGTLQKQVRCFSCGGEEPPRATRSMITNQPDAHAPSPQHLPPGTCHTLGRLTTTLGVQLASTQQELASTQQLLVVSRQETRAANAAAARCQRSYAQQQTAMAQLKLRSEQLQTRACELLQTSQVWRGW